MIKIPFKRHLRRKVIFLIGIFLLISLGIVVLSINKQASPEQQDPQQSSKPLPSDTPKTNESRSDANTALMADAAQKKDVAICDQINGGITEKMGESRTLPDGAIADSFGHPAMTESEAKAQCRKQATDE